MVYGEDAIKTVYHAAIYLRLSKEDGDMTSGGKYASDSISNQKSLILDFLKDQHDIQVVSVREDDGYSGVDFDRPGFQLMLEDIKEGRVDCVIVKDLSRFGRNYIETGWYLEKLFPMLGIRFIAVNDRYDSLKAEASYDLLLPFKNLINDSYCRDLSVKIRSHLAIKRKKGEFVGAFACYGYLKDTENKNRLVIDPYAGNVVRDIFRMKVHGYSQHKIAEILNEHGVLSPMEYKHSLGIRFETSFQVKPKALWSSKAVLRILTNEVYTGVLIQGRQTTPNHKVKARQQVRKCDWIRVENTHEPLITPCFFEIVQMLLERDTRTSPKAESVFPLSGLLYCGDCGRPMVRKTTGGSYACFVCQGHSKTADCSWHRIREEELLYAVFQAINYHVKYVLDRDKVYRNKDLAPSAQVISQKYEDHIKKKEEEWNRTADLQAGIYADLKEGILDKAEYEMLKQNFENRRHETEKEIRELQKELAAVQERQVRPCGWIDYFKEVGELQELSRLAAAVLIDRIFIYEDKRIRIRFHFEDTWTRGLHREVEGGA